LPTRRLPGIRGKRKLNKAITRFEWGRVRSKKPLGRNDLNEIKVWRPPTSAAKKWGRGRKTGRTRTGDVIPNLRGCRKIDMDYGRTIELARKVPLSSRCYFALLPGSGKERGREKEREKRGGITQHSWVHVERGEESLEFTGG